MIGGYKGRFHRCFLIERKKMRLRNTSQNVSCSLLSNSSSMLLPVQSSLFLFVVSCPKTILINLCPPLSLSKVCCPENPTFLSPLFSPELHYFLLIPIPPTQLICFSVSHLKGAHSLTLSMETCFC